MIIKDPLFGPNKRIKSEEHCWAIQVYSHTPEGKGIWKSKHFFSTPEQAIKHICKDRMKNSDIVKSLTAYLSKLEQLRREIERCLSDSESF